MKQIKVSVAQDGAVEIKTEGFRGGECKLATADLEKSLGVVGSDRLTHEAYLDQIAQGHESAKRR